MDAGPEAPTPPPAVNPVAAFPSGVQINEFRGGAATLFGTQLLGALITVFTLGICYPFAMVMLQRWRVKNTYLYGRQMAFNGTATGLFGHWIKWFCLTIITLGIYSFWVVPRLTRWQVEHTVFA